MKKYKVYGMVTVNVTKEVWANNEDEALEKAREQLSCLTAYCGNGGYDKMVGVEGDGETVETFEDIAYDDWEELEDDPDYFECPECYEKCEKKVDSDGVEYWKCQNCYETFNLDGFGYAPLDEEEDE